ncbi:hypothetical protein [Aquimarina algiphila]|nr:hypothetical protein [Aquimarina algiphila]
MGSSLLFGIFILVAGTFYGTFLIHTSNRKATTDRIDRLQAAFTSQNTQLKKISEIIRNEQREKGSLKLKVGKFNRYFVSFGLVNNMIDANDINNEYTNRINNVPFSLVINDDDELLVTIRILDTNGEIIFDMVRGNWALKRIDNFSVNFDNTGLEILGKKGEVLLQIDITDNRIEISGILNDENSSSFVSPNELVQIPFSNLNYQNTWEYHFQNLNRKFVHHGQNYLGKRIIQTP